MKKARLFLFLLYPIVAVLIIGLMLEFLVKTNLSDSTVPAEDHFAVLIPAQNGDGSDVHTAIDLLAKEFSLDMEIHEFATVADQKQMLRLIPSTEIDGVLLWPISIDDADYEAELSGLNQAEIPVVIVERDVAQTQRSSFIGSGTNSDLIVLEQHLKELNDQDYFVVANRFGSGNSQIVEWVLFKNKRYADAALSALPQDQKLRHLVLNPPEKYLATALVRLDGDNARSLQLKYALTSLFEENNMKLFFSLDESLSTTAISAKRSLAEHTQSLPRLLCYGSTADHQKDLSTGILDGLVTPKPAVSITIGIRYLRDVCRDFWVPKTMDSGIDFLTAYTT